MFERATEPNYSGEIVNLAEAAKFLSEIAYNPKDPQYARNWPALNEMDNLIKIITKLRIEAYTSEEAEVNWSIFVLEHFVVVHSL